MAPIAVALTLSNLDRAEPLLQAAATCLAPISRSRGCPVAGMVSVAVPRDPVQAQGRKYEVRGHDEDCNLRIVTGIRSGHARRDIHDSELYQPEYETAESASRQHLEKAGPISTQGGREGFGEKESQAPDSSNNGTQPP
jgi:hypothetical protein